MSDGRFDFAVLFLLLAGTALVLAAIGSRGVIRARTSARRAVAGVVGLCGGALLLSIGWWTLEVGPGRSGVVVAGASTGGQEYCLVQTFKGATEPYQVSLYVRDESGKWRWHYLEHEGFAWRSARVELADGQASVYRDGELFAELELESGPAEPEPLSPGGYPDLETLPAELTVADVARLHQEKFRR